MGAGGGAAIGINGVSTFLIDTNPLNDRTAALGSDVYIQRFLQTPGYFCNGIQFSERVMGYR